MIKHFCDICKKELTKEEVKFSYEMIGYGEFCKEHMPKIEYKIYVSQGKQDESYKGN